MQFKKLNKCIIGLFLYMISFYTVATDGLFLEGFGPISRGMGGTAVSH